MESSHDRKMKFPIASFTNRTGKESRYRLDIGEIENKILLKQNEKDRPLETNTIN